MILDNLPHSCSAQRRSRTVDSLGGSKDAWTTLWSDRACWRQPSGDNESEMADRRTVSHSHKVYFVTDPELDERDRLVFSDGNFDVKSAAEPDASIGMSVVYRVMVGKDSGEG